MKRWTIITLSLAGVLILGLIIIFSSLVSSKDVAAQLIYESGEVFVNGAVINSDVGLQKRDIVETKDGTATVILYESVIVNMDKNTKISIEDLERENIELEQEYGTTWNKITRLFGIENYTISSGETVASVRGTFFQFSKNKILLEEGVLDVTLDGKKLQMNKGEVIEKIPDMELIRRQITEKENQDATQDKLRLIASLKKLRRIELEKNEVTLDLIKFRYKLTDEDINNGFEEADKGNLDLDEIEKSIPVKIESVDKIKGMTLKIRELNQETGSF